MLRILVIKWYIFKTTYLFVTEISTIYWNPWSETSKLKETANNRQTNSLVRCSMASWTWGLHSISSAHKMCKTKCPFWFVLHGGGINLKDPQRRRTTMTQKRKQELQEGSLFTNEEVSIYSDDSVARGSAGGREEGNCLNELPNCNQFQLHSQLEHSFHRHRVHDLFAITCTEQSDPSRSISQWPTVAAGKIGFTRRHANRPGSDLGISLCVSLGRPSLIDGASVNRRSLEGNSKRSV